MSASSQGDLYSFGLTSHRGLETRMARDRTRSFRVERKQDWDIWDGSLTRPQLGFFQQHLGFCLSRREFVRQNAQRLKFHLRGPQSPPAIHLLHIRRTLNSLRLPRRQRQIPTKYYPEQAPFNAENVGPAVFLLKLLDFALPRCGEIASHICTKLPQIVMASDAWRYALLREGATNWPSQPFHH